jgi:2-polyprenyl-3-methyl-5-hydroxy-6-metoxy-1,4-benzoquinol methylase
MKKEELIFEQLKDVLDKSGNGEFEKWSKDILSKNIKRFLNDIKYIKKYCKSGEILEIGSAPYHLTYALSKLDYSVIGIDIDPSRFEKFIKEQNLNIIKHDIENYNLPFNDNEFQFVIFNEIFEHLRIDPISTLREINRILKPNGILMLTTPNLYSIQNIVRFFRGRGFDNPYKQFEQLHKIGHMGHVRLYSVKQVNEFLNNTGFEVIETNKISYVPLTGLYAPLNLIRSIFPGFHTVQVNISSKKLK